MPGDRDGIGMPCRVRYQIGETALERGRLHRDHGQSVKHHGRGMAMALGIAAQFFQRRGHVGRLRLLAAVAARKRKVVLQHARHLVDIPAHAVDFGAVADQGQFELEAGQDGAKVVRHAGQHRGALLDRALDARFHLDEGLRRAADFAGAARMEIRRLAALAETFRRVRQPQDRLDLVAQEQHRDDQQDRRGADHPEQEDFRIRRIGGAALRENPHHRVVELDADFHQIGAADGIDPERPARSAAPVAPTASGRAARRTVSGPAAAYRRPGGNRPPAPFAAGRSCAAGRGPCPADRPCRHRSGWRCPAPPPPRAAASPYSSAAP